MIRDRRGAALPIALISMLVLTLLGTGLWQYSTTDTIQVARQENRMKAFYIARSGAEATAKWMVDKGASASDMVGKNSMPTDLGDGSFSVTIEEEDPYDPGNRVIIHSTATVGGVSARASLALSRISGVNVASYPSGFFPYAIYAEEYIILGGNVFIDGSVGIPEDGDLTINGAAVTIDGDTDRVDMGYEDAEFPYDGDPQPDLSPTGQPQPVEIKAQRYGVVDVGPGRHLEFKTPGVMEVRMSSLETRNANIIIADGTKVRLFIDELFDHKGSVEASSSDQLIVFMAPDSQASLPIGNSVFRGYVYGPNAHVDFSGTQNFHGAIVAGTVFTNGNAGVFHPGVTEGEWVYPEDVEDYFEDGFEIDYWIPTN